MSKFNRANPGERRYKAKLVMRWLALILTIACIALTIYARVFSWPLWIPLGLSFIWNIANIARRLSAPTPIHPGANVAIDLIIWLTFFSTLVWTYFVSVLGLMVTRDNVWGYEFGSVYDNYTSNSSTWTSDSLNDSFSGSTDSYNAKQELTQDMLDEIHKLSAVALVAAVLGTIDFILHFSLFVIACVDTHRYRHSDRYPEYRRDYEKLPLQQQPFLGTQSQQQAYPHPNVTYQQGYENLRGA